MEGDFEPPGTEEKIKHWHIGQDPSGDDFGEMATMGPVIPWALKAMLRFSYEASLPGGAELLATQTCM